MKPTAGLRPLFALLFAILPFASTCGDGKSHPAKGFVAARVIADPADLIGGPRAEGRLGDFLLVNDHVRMIVAGAESAVGFNPFGGSLLDADVVRPSGEPGQDRFGEAFPTLNILTAADVETVEVVQDGSDLRRASIRVTGSGFPFPIVPSIPGLTSPVAASFETVYSLTPDSSSVLIETSVTLHEAETTLVQAYDVLLFGSGLDLFGAPLGEGETGDYEWYGGDTAGIAYAWLPLGDPRDTMSIPLSDAAQQIAQMGPLTIAPEKTKTFRRRLVIAAPDLGAVNAEIARVRGKATGLLTGSVRDTVGGPVAGAFVRVVAVGVDRDENGEDDLFGRARSGEDGTFAIELTPGVYQAQVSADLRGEGTPLEFTSRKGKTAQILFILPSLGTVSFAATDAANGSPIAAKLTVVNGAGAIVARALGGVQGLTSVAVPPGNYTAYLSRGPEWELRQSAVTVTAGGGTTLPGAESALDRRIPTPGFLAGDFHIHTVQSRDADPSLATRVLSLAAEGLEYVASTDHDRASDFAPDIAALGLTGKIASVVGSEVSVPLYGHFNAYPMPAGSAVTREYDGTRALWYDMVLGRTLNGVEVLAKMRALPGDRIVQMNHPRSTQGYLDSVQYDPATGTSSQPVALDFDTIEVNGEIDPVAGQTITDWFSILKAGHRVTGVGVSDTHSTWNPAYPRTLVHVGTDDPAAVSDAAFIAGMRSGKVTVSSGPFVLASAQTLAFSAGLGDTLDATGGAAVSVHVHVEAPSFAPYDTLKLYENGTLVATVPLAPALAGGKFVSDVDVPVAAAADAFYVAVVTGGGTLFPVSGKGVYAYTNPVYVDRAPAGWTPPGL